MILHYPHRPMSEFVAFRAYLVYPENWRASGATPRGIGMTACYTVDFCLYCLYMRLSALSELSHATSCYSYYPLVAISIFRITRVYKLVD